MIIGIGVDIIEIERFRCARCFDRLCEYILTNTEQQGLRTSRDPVQFVASRFAAKEAVIKAFPVALTLQEVEIAKTGERPHVIVHHPSSAAYKTLVSISHTTAHAVGMACVHRA